jgi:hypothetical protein
MYMSGVCFVDVLVVFFCGEYAGAWCMFCCCIGYILLCCVYVRVLCMFFDVLVISFRVVCMYAPGICFVDVLSISFWLCVCTCLVYVL